MEAVIPGAICGGEQGLILNFGDQDDVRQQGQASLLDDIDRRLVLHVRDHGSLEECEQVGATSIRSNSAHTPIVGRNASHPLSPLSPKAGKDNVPWNDRNAAHGTIDTEVIDAIAPPVRSDTERQYEMRAVPKTTTPPPNSLFNTTLSKKELTQRAFQLYNSKKHSTDPTDSISLNELSEYRQFLYRDFIGQRNPGMLTMMRLKERYGVRPRSPDMLRWAFREWGFPRQRMAPDWMLHPVWICEDLGFDDDLTAFHIRAIAKKDLKGIDVHRAKAHKQYYTHKAEVMGELMLDASKTFSQ
ncbi:hypothetical protein MMC25_003312 [Agyrium rufum]|nr:hypothetical protein [Agyrium rufum]